MTKRPRPARPATWRIFKLARQTDLARIEAADEREAIEKAAAEFRQPPRRSQWRGGAESKNQRAGGSGLPFDIVKYVGAIGGEVDDPRLPLKAIAM
jgi:hypothetical protein